VETLVWGRPQGKPRCSVFRPHDGCDRLAALIARKVCRLAIALALVGVGSACGGSSPPTPVSPTNVLTPPPATAAPEISGTVWLHSRDGVRRYGKVPFGGWVQSEASGAWTWGSVDEQGRYTLRAAEAARVHLQVAGGPLTFQPCVVMLEPGDRATRDVRVIDDPSQLGAHLPPDLLANTPLLSGVAYEVAEDGRRVPLAQVRLTLDPLSGLGFVAATTLSDELGRYVLCGLRGATSTYVFASKDGYQLFEQNVPLNGNTTLDIQMRR
jgi:hypothetical protein